MCVSEPQISVFLLHCINTHSWPSCQTLTRLLTDFDVGSSNFLDGVEMKERESRLLLTAAVQGDSCSFWMIGRFAVAVSLTLNGECSR